MSGQGGHLLRHVDSPGEEYGLYLTLNAEQHFYFHFTETAGFKVFVHDQAEPPQDIANYGIAVTPGYRTSIALTKKQVYNTSFDF